MTYFDKKTLWNGVNYVSPRILSTLASLAIIPVVLRSVEAAEYGIYALYLSISTFFVVFTFPRISFESKAGLAQGQDEAFWGTLVDRFLVSLPVLVTPPILALSSAQMGFKLDIPLGLVVFYGTVIPTILFQAINNFYVAKEEFFRASMIELFRAAVVGTAAAAVAYFTQDIFCYATGKAVLDGASLALMLLALSTKRGLWNIYRTRPFTKTVRNYGLRMLPSTVAAETKLQFTIWAVAAFLGAEAMAIYQVAFSNLFQKVNNQAVSLANLFYARVARRKGTRAMAEERVEAIGAAAVGFALAFISGLLGYAYVELLLPENYSSVSIYFLILCASLPITLTVNVQVLRLLVNFEASKLTLVNVCTALFQIALSAGLTYYAGLTGACLSVLAGNVANLILVFLVTSERRFV